MKFREWYQSNDAAIIMVHLCLIIILILYGCIWGIDQGTIFIDRVISVQKSNHRCKVHGTVADVGATELCLVQIILIIREKKDVKLKFYILLFLYDE